MCKLRWIDWDKASHFKIPTKVSFIFHFPVEMFLQDFFSLVKSGSLKPCDLIVIRDRIITWMSLHFLDLSHAVLPLKFIGINWNLP